MKPPLIIHRADKKNTGDLASNPQMYHKWLADAEVWDIDSSAWLWKIRDRDVILGGGGLLNAGWSDLLMALADAPWRTLTLWGIGQNKHINEHTPWDEGFDQVIEYLKSKATLVGLRDMRATNDWIPCASVAHPFFESPPAPIHPVVAYQHREERFQFDTELPSIAADESLIECLEHIASGENVVSSSYHGCLWAALMERPSVAMNPFSTKFKTGLPAQVKPIGSDMEISFLPIDMNFRSECFRRNAEFAAKVKELIVPKH